MIRELAHAENNIGTFPPAQRIVGVNFWAGDCGGDSAAGGEYRPMATKKKIAAFDPKVFLSRIGSGRTTEKFASGSVVFSQGDPAAAVYYLQKGKIKITVTSKNGKEAVAGDRRARRFFRRGLPERPDAAHGDGHCHG